MYILVPLLGIPYLLFISKVASNIAIISSDMPKILLGGDGQTLLPHPAPAATATAGHIAGEAAMAKEERSGV
jgi:hypothetical protein